MSFKTKSYKLLAVLAIFAVMAGIAYAAAPVAETASQDVGGLPLCLSFTGTSATPQVDIDLDLPDGFTPAFIYGIMDADTDTTATQWWMSGMADASTFSITAAGVTDYVASTGWDFDATNNKLVMQWELQFAGGLYAVRVCR